eukprot:1281338-Prymnesium_polylepis.1
MHLREVNCLTGRCPAAARLAGSTGRVLRCDPWAREEKATQPSHQAPRHSALDGLGSRRKVFHSRIIAAELCGDVRATTALCE